MLPILISVTRTTGVARTGLTAADFLVDTSIVAPGGSAVTVTNLSAGGQPWPYLMMVVPIGNNTWKRGTYLFWVAVVAGNDRGETVFSVSLD